MVARVRSTRTDEPKKTKGKHGGPRPNSGRPKGVPNKFNERAVRQARLRGNRLPHELLLEWANTGLMHDGHKKKVELDPSQRIQCANGAAPYYGQKLAPRQVEGQQPQVLRLELDASRLAGMPTDKLQIIQEVLRAIAAGAPGMEGLVPSTGRADPRRYEQSLRPDSETHGRA